MGNYITVQITKVPGAMKTISLEAGSTVEDALTIAELEVATGYEIRVDDEIVSRDTELEDGNVVVITKMIKGN